METNDAIKRRIKRNQMQRNVRRSELMVRRLFALIRFIMVLGIIFLTYKLVNTSHWYVPKEAFNSPKNPYLKIMGNDITPEYKILNALRKTDVPNVPIYLISTIEMEKNISQIEPVKRVFIRRFWFPGRFVVMIEESKPILIISPSDNVPPIAFFTDNGRLIGREYLPLKKQYNTTLVLTYGTRGDDYRNWNEAKVKNLDKLAKTITSRSGEKVKYIDLRNPKDVYIQLQSVKLRLGELDASVFSKIEALNSILQEIKSIKSFNKKIKYVDLRWDTYYLKLEDDNENSTGTNKS